MSASGPRSTTFSGNSSMSQYRDSQTPMSGDPFRDAPTFSGDSRMSQHRDGQALLSGDPFRDRDGRTATSGSHYAPTSSDGDYGQITSSHVRSGSYGSAGLSPTSPTAQPYRPMSAKEREALRQRGESGLALVSAAEEGEGLVQHSDGGRISEPEPPSRPAREIPPSYYSIPVSAEPPTSKK